MSKFTATAESHWRNYRPAEYAELTDPQTFFQQLGQEIEDQVQSMAQAIAGPERPGEDFRAKWARLQSARFDAETDVLREMLPPPTTADLEEQEDRLAQEQFDRLSALERRQRLSEEAWAQVDLEHHSTPQEEQHAFEVVLAQLEANAATLDRADR